MRKGLLRSISQFVLLTMADYSGDGSGYGEISSVLQSNSPVYQLEEKKEYVPMDRDQRLLWRDTFGDLRGESENARIASLLNYINTDGLPEQFRRLTSEYLGAMIQLISKRLRAAPFTRELTECTDRLPEQFYQINYAAHDHLRHCPPCLGDIGVKYVNSVHDLVLALFNCLDSHIRPSASAERN